MHAILSRDVSAFAGKILYSRFLGRNCENVGTPLKHNKNLFSSFLKFMKIIESLGHLSLDI